MTGHLACPPSRRGHTWREMTADDFTLGLQSRPDPQRRICARCGALGRVDGQGRVETG